VERSKGTLVDENQTNRKPPGPFQWTPIDPKAGDPVFARLGRYINSVIVGEDVSDDTLWLSKRAGDDTLADEDGGTVYLHGDNTPDRVRLPPELGGQVEEVEAAFWGPCPCGQHERVRHLSLETVKVAECPVRGFLWYR
jgi:hypothetical protein